MRFRGFLTGEGVASEKELDGLDARAQKDIEAALEFSNKSPEPKIENIFDDVYA